MLWFIIFPPVLLETNQPHVFLHILPISVRFSNFWFSNRKREKTCCKQGNTSLETQNKIFLAISKPLPASRQTNILLPTGLEFQHLFMFKRVNKRKHAVSGKKRCLETQYKGFLAISTPLPARRQRFHFPQSLKFSTFKWEDAKIKLRFETYIILRFRSYFKAATSKQNNHSVSYSPCISAPFQF